MQTITTIDLIRRSMYLINAVAAGEIPDDADLNDALLALKEMLDGWNIQNLAVYASPVENFVVTPGQATYNWGATAGPTGITSARPVQVENVTCVRNGVSYPVTLISQDEYDEIPVKATPGALIDRLLYVNSFPLGKVTLYPVPTEAVTLTMNTLTQLNDSLTLQSTIALPPGYLRAIRYNLAVELWPEYTNSSTDIAAVRKEAMTALGDVKRANFVATPSSFSDIPNVDCIGYDWRG